jgi:hypothetical protein
MSNILIRHCCTLPHALVLLVLLLCAFFMCMAALYAADGVLYGKRVKDLSELANDDELAAEEAAAQGGVPGAAESLLLAVCYVQSCVSCLSLERMCLLHVACSGTNAQLTCVYACGHCLACSVLPA